LKDLDEIDKAFNKNNSAKIKMVNDLVERIFPTINSETSIEKIIEIFLNDEMVLQRMTAENSDAIKKFVGDFAEKIAGKELTRDDFFRAIFETTDTYEIVSLKEKRLAMMREIVSSKQ
jgi:hypothetical protein